MVRRDYKHTASLGRRGGLISAQVTTSIPNPWARAWCGDECWDQPISLCPTMMYVFYRTNIYLKQQNQTEQSSVLKSVRDGLISHNYFFCLVVKADSMGARKMFSVEMVKRDTSNFGRIKMQGRLQKFGLWYAHMMPRSVCVCVCGGGGDYNSTVIIESKQCIYNIYNLFIIYITSFIIGITWLMIGIIIYIFQLYIIDIFIVIR